MSGAKKAILIVAIVIVVILLALVIAPFFINVEQFRPQIEAALSSKLGRQVQLGHIRVSLFSGSLSVDQISIADDPAYSSEPFLTAKSLSAGIDVMPLIFSRSLRIHSLEFKDPHVQLLRTASGQWNFTSLGAGVPAQHSEHSRDSVAVFLPVALNVAVKSAQATGALSSLSVEKMKISNGTIAFGRAGQATGPGYQDVDLSAQNISETAPFPFQFNAKTPGGGQITLSGNLGPLGTNDGSHVPFDGRAKAEEIPAQDIENLLAVLGYSFPAGSHLKGGTIKADLTLRGPMDSFAAEGPIQLRGVTLAGFSLPSKLAGALGQVAQAGNDTVINVAEGGLQYGPQGIRAESLNVVIASIGSVTGNGTVSAANVLDFHLIAKLEGSTPLAQFTRLPIFNQGGGIPFRIEGNAASPQVAVDLPGLNKTPLNQLKIPSGLSGLFHKKTTPR